MAAKLISKPKLLKEFLEISTKNKYFAASVENNLIRNIEFLSHAKNLQANIERQWLFKNRDIENNLKTYANAEFLEYGENLSLLEKYAVIRKRDRLAKTVPFGLIEIEHQQRSNVFGLGNSDNASFGIQLDNGAKLLTCSYLVNDKQSQEYFYRIQRMRKIWWMKYAANPGRFLISEVIKDETRDTKSVSIKATYPFGTVEIESIEVKPLESYESQSEPKNKNQPPTNVIKTTAAGEIAVIETVLDSIDAGDFGEMCLHRKIAPYQCTVFSLVNDPSTSTDLRELMEYVTMLLEKCEISLLHTDVSQFSENSALEQKCNEMDAIGVPYELILDSDSLKTGFMKLRNRDTTLSETIHISCLNEYLPQIFRA